MGWEQPCTRSPRAALSVVEEEGEERELKKLKLKWDGNGDLITQRRMRRTRAARTWNTFLRGGRERESC